MIVRACASVWHAMCCVSECALGVHDRVPTSVWCVVCVRVLGVRVPVCESACARVCSFVWRVVCACVKVCVCESVCVSVYCFDSLSCEKL